MITSKELPAGEISLALFAFFQRTQTVTKCWRKIDGEWTVKNVSFVEDWLEQDYLNLVRYLKNLCDTQGFVAGAFSDGQLKGFVAVEPAVFGSQIKYLNLSYIHVSRDMRGNGIGKRLFCLAKDWAREHGAQRLYISANSAVETMDFYRAMGCVETAEYNLALAEKEPCDCQLECSLS